MTAVCVCHQALPVWAMSVIQQAFPTLPPHLVHSSPYSLPLNQALSPPNNNHSTTCKP